MNFAFSLSHCALAPAQLFFWYSFAFSTSDWMWLCNFTGAEVMSVITLLASACANPVIPARIIPIKIIFLMSAFLLGLRSQIRCLATQGVPERIQCFECGFRFSATDQGHSDQHQYSDCQELVSPSPYHSSYVLS